MVRDACSVQPATPEMRRRRQPRVGLVDVLRAGEPLGPCERAIALLALTQYMASPYAVALEPERHVREKPDRHALCARVGSVGSIGDSPLGGDPAVVEYRLTREFQLDLAL